MNIQHSRSLLFVPGDRPERFNKAKDSGADCIIIDLEDAVNPSAKAYARDAIRDYLLAGGSAYIRINPLDSHYASGDLELCSLPGVEGIVIPKAESPNQLTQLYTQMRPNQALLPLIETAAGLTIAGEIAQVKGVQRLIFGSIDFCLDLQLEDNHAVLAPYRAMLVLASRRAGLPGPVDGVTLTIQHQQELHQAISQAQQAGFRGKLCIHPNQVAEVNAGFTPSAEMLAWAETILQIAATSNGAFQHEGKMIDAPVLARARQIQASTHCWP